MWLPKRGLIVRVGKDQHSRALARADAKPMEMSGRPMAGYVFIDPPPRDERTLRDWLELGVAFVNTLPAKPRGRRPGGPRPNKLVIASVKFRGPARHSKRGANCPP